MQTKKISVGFVSLTYAQFLSPTLLPTLKAQHGLRVFAIVEAPLAHAVPETVAGSLDACHVLPCGDVHGMTGAFDWDDLRRVVEAERRAFPEHELRLVCSEEFNLVHTGRLRRELGLRGPQDTELENYRDKLRMKTLLHKAGVRVPRFLALRGDETHKALVSQLGPAYVVKPVDAAGSAGVHCIRGVDDFAAFQRETAGTAARFEAEEYITGTLYHVDSIFDGRHPVFQAVSEYTCPNLEFRAGRVLGSMPVAADDPVHAKLRAFAERVHAVLGPQGMSTHMEVFVADGEPVFLEIAARSPGTICSRAHLSNYGVNINDLDFEVQTGLAVPRAEVSRMPAFWAYLPRPPGRVVRRTAPVLESGMDLRWQVDVGDEDVGSGSVLDASASLLARHPDFATLRRDFELLREFVGVECVPSGATPGPSMPVVAAPAALPEQVES